ncbi:MAG: hypothetical protein EHM81_00670 [Chloroflexi bacterium]|nr:MAG: hypothetical protein EHM81_00670 [Chloroflexota bacterium]
MSKSSGSLYPRVFVKDTDGTTTICEDYSSNTAEIESCSLGSTGTYTIQAQGGYSGTDTGDYYLFLQRINNPGSFTAISFGQTLFGSITTPAEMDTYTFGATNGDKVLVRASKSTGSLNLGIRVYSPDGSTKLCENSSSYTAEITSCPLTSTGTFTVMVSDGYEGTNTGDYYLYLQRLNNPGSPGSIAFGQTLSGSITTPAELDTYTFAATAGDKVLVRMSKSAGSLYPEIRIFNPAGTTELCSEYSSNTAEIANCPLTVTGTYTILAGDGYLGTYTGDYYLYLQRLNNPGSPTAITFGQTLPGSITMPAEMDTYTFAASAGDKVLARMGKTTGNLGSQIRIYGTDGTTKLCESYSSTTTAEIATCPLYNTGTYTILVFDGYPGTNTGDYDLHLQRLNNPGNAVPISFGQTIPSSITMPAEMDAYVFTANAGDKAYVSISRTSGSLNPGLRIYTPDGSKLCDSSGYDSADIGNCPINTTGAYTILVYDGYNNPYTGDYLLRYGNQVTLTSIASQDGWVLETSETSGKGGKVDAKAKTFQLGDDALNRQYRAILSFDTSQLPTSSNIIIQSATLRIKASGKPAGLDPFKSLKPLRLDIRYNYFGIRNTLEAGDFQASYSARKVGTFVKKSDGWYAANLNAAGISNIYKYGVTQFRLYFSKDDNNNLKADYQKFFSGNNPTNKPALVITYTLP